MAKPKPMWGSRPILVSAGNSETGRDFAAHNADCLFTTIPPRFEDLAVKIAAFRTAAPAGQQRTLAGASPPANPMRQVFSSAHLVVRKTRKEAEDYQHYIVHEQGDWDAADYAYKLRGSRVGVWLEKADEQRLKARLISGAGYPIVGSYDDAVATFQRMSEAGLDGMALGMVNYIDELARVRDELLPRMERAGLRVRFS